jgi:hypothetical protein
MEESLGQEKIVLCYLFIDSVATGLPLTQSLVLIGVCGRHSVVFSVVESCSTGKSRSSSRATGKTKIQLKQSRILVLWQGPQTAIYKTRSGLMKRVKHVLPQFLQQEQIRSRTNARARLLMESTIEAQFRSVLS